MHSFVDDVGVGVIVVATVVMRPPVNFVSSLRRQYVLYLHHLGGVPVQIGDGRRSVVVGAFPHARGSHAFVLQPEAASDVLDEQNVGPARHAARAAAVVKVEDHHAEADGQRAQGHRHAEVQHCKRHGSWNWVAVEALLWLFLVHRHQQFDDAAIVTTQLQLPDLQMKPRITFLNIFARNNISVCFSVSISTTSLESQHAMQEKNLSPEAENQVFQLSVSSGHVCAFRCIATKEVNHNIFGWTVCLIFLIGSHGPRVSCTSDAWTRVPLREAAQECSRSGCNIANASCVGVQMKIYLWVNAIA